MEKYKQIKGVMFPVETPLEVCEVLLKCVGTGRRIRVFYGDLNTGEHDLRVYWLHMTKGKIGCVQKSPKGTLELMANVKSVKGVPIEGNIVKITEDKKVLYSHANFNLGKLMVETTPKRGRVDYSLYKWMDGEKQRIYTTYYKEDLEWYLDYMRGVHNKRRQD